MNSAPTTSTSPSVTSVKTDLGFMLILSALMAFTSLSTDIYLPALPQMKVDLQGDVELTITGFLIGFTIAQLIWGPISDRIGRKIPLFIGMILFIVGSAGCALSQNIEQIVFWRIFQALGACIGPMLARAIIRDCFERTQAAQMMSTLIIIMAIAPIAGPLIGGQLIQFSTWHSIFWLLAIIGVLMFLSLFYLPETHPIEKRSHTSFLHAFAQYGSLLTHKKFMVYTLAITFYYLGVYAFITGSPFVYITYFQVDPGYFGWLFAVNIFGLMALSFLNRSLVKRFTLDTLLQGATLVAMLAAIALALCVYTQTGGIVSIVLTVFIVFSMNGILAATATASALDGVPHIAGSASAFIGALQYGSGIISSVLLAEFSDGTPWPMASLILIACVLSSAMIWLFNRKQA